MTVTAAASGPVLARELRRGDLVALTLNNVIGAGIFTMPSALAAGAGSLSVTILILTIVLISMMALCLIEVASRFDRTGGPTVYAFEAFGPATGFIVGWLMYLSRLSAFGAITVVMLDYGAGLWPALEATPVRIAVITGVVVVLAVINLRGVVRGARMSGVLAAMKIALLMLVALGGLWVAARASGPLPPFRGFENLGDAILVAFFACMGFETGAVMAGEVRNPRRDLPAGILGGIAGVAVLYTLLMIACLRLVPDLAHSARPIADAAASLLGAKGAAAAATTAVLSCAGTLTVMVITTPRILYALAAESGLSPALASIEPSRRTPAIAILTTAVIFWLLTVSGTFVYLATFSAMARILMYGSTCVALIVLRRRDGPAPVPMRWGPALALLSLAVSVAAIAGTSGTQVRDLLIAVAVGWGIRAVLLFAAPYQEVRGCDTRSRAR